MRCTEILLKNLQAAGDELEQFRNPPSAILVYLDDYEKVRRQGSIHAVLKATGVNCWGKREVIGVCRLRRSTARVSVSKAWSGGCALIAMILLCCQKSRFSLGALAAVSPEPECSAARRSDQRAAMPLTFETFNAPSGGEAEAMLRARVEQYTKPGAGRLDGDQSAGSLRSFVTFYLAAHSHQQRAGEPKPSDSSSVSFQTPSPHYDSSPRRFTKTADRETVPQPGRFQTTGESDLRSLSVKLQKNSCLAPDRLCRWLFPQLDPRHP